MKKIDPISSSAYRKQAEEILRKMPPVILPKNEAETLKLIHKLQLQQIELELQNKELSLSNEFEALLNSAHDAILIRNTDDKIVFWNKGAEKKYGWKPEEISNKIAHELLHTKFPKPLPEIKNDVAQFGVWEGELTHTTRNGKKIVVNSRWAAHQGPTGHFSGILEINRDVTESKLAEAALAKISERLELATHAANIGIWDWNIAENKLIWDDRMYHLYGLKKSNMPGAYEAWLSGVHPDDRELCDEIVREAVKGNQEYDTEFRIIWPDGSIHWLKATGQVFFDENKNPLRMVGVNYDITERKKAEEALRISEASYRNIFESAVIGIYRTTPDGKILMANSTLIKLLGFDSFEDLAQRNLEVEGFEKDEQRKEFREKIEKDGSINSFESVWKTKTGNPVFVNENAKAIFDTDGKVIYYEGTIEDITERKLTEEALRKNEALLKEMGRIAHVGGWEFNALTGEANWTEEVARIHDLEPQLPVSVESGIRYYADHSKPVIEKAVREAIEQAKPYDLELEIVSAKGIHKWIRTIGHPIVENGKVVKVSGSFQDISVRKREEQALRESRDLLANLARLVPGVIYQYRLYPDGRSAFPYASPGMNDIYEVTPEEVQEDATPVFGRLHPEDYDQVVRAIRESADTLNTFYCEFRVNLPRQGLRWRWSQAHPQRMEDGSILWHGIISDITERKLAEEEIKQLNETLERRVETRTAELSEANKELEAFSYSVSHDLRAPLRHINGFVDLLTEKYRDSLPEKAQHYLKTIVDASNQMGNLIDDLLELSRTGRKEMLQIKMDMNLVLNESMTMLKEYPEKRNIRWEIANLPKITGDHALLKMVWFNLLSNAVKFTKSKEPAIIQIGYLEEDAEYVFFVRDNGAGFDMQYAHKLFGVFQRLHPIHEFEGTGIGLANVRRIILKHSGRTWAESQPDQGATFYFTLPKNQEEE